MTSQVSEEAEEAPECAQFTGLQAASRSRSGTVTLSFPTQPPKLFPSVNKNYSPMRAKVWASSQSKVKCRTGANNYFNECVHPHISHSAGKTKQSPKNNVCLIRKLTTFGVESLVTGNAFKTKSVFGFTRMVNGQQVCGCGSICALRTWGSQRTASCVDPHRSPYWRLGLSFVVTAETRLGGPRPSGIIPPLLSQGLIT